MSSFEKIFWLVIVIGFIKPVTYLLLLPFILIWDSIKKDQARFKALLDKAEASDKRRENKIDLNRPTN